MVMWSVIVKNRRLLGLSVALIFLVSACSSQAATNVPGPTSTNALIVGTTNWVKLPYTDARSGQQGTLADLTNAGKTVVVEAMAVWCTNCLHQASEVAKALSDPSLSGITYVSIDIDSSEDAPKLENYATTHNFSDVNWKFVVSSKELTKALTDQFGRGITYPPNTPIFVISSKGVVSQLYTGGLDSDVLIKTIQSNA
jgi:hypothetical protein